MDVLDLLLEGDAKDIVIPKDDSGDTEADLDALIEDFSTGTTATKKAALRAMLKLLK